MALLESDFQFGQGGGMPSHDALARKRANIRRQVESAGIEELAQALEEESLVRALGDTAFDSGEQDEVEPSASRLGEMEIGCHRGLDVWLTTAGHHLPFFG